VNGLWFAISVSSCQGGQLIDPDFLADEFFCEELPEVQNVLDTVCQHLWLKTKPSLKICCSV